MNELSLLLKDNAAPATPGAKHSYWLYPMRVEGIDVNLFAQEMITSKYGFQQYTENLFTCVLNLYSKKRTVRRHVPSAVKMRRRLSEIKRACVPTRKCAETSCPHPFG
jgi:hypothetical protein